MILFFNFKHDLLHVDIILNFMQNTQPLNCCYKEVSSKEHLEEVLLPILIFFSILLLSTCFSSIWKCDNPVARFLSHCSLVDLLFSLPCCIIYETDGNKPTCLHRESVVSSLEKRKREKDEGLKLSFAFLLSFSGGSRAD